jgi:NADPH:quinone reductase-like Zn-dependent oxidoreductase
MPSPRGALTNLAAVPVDAARPGPGEVIVTVRAVGINFRDVLNVLGMYPGDPGPPGADSAGVVLAVGAGVTYLQPGDAVFGLQHLAKGPGRAAHGLVGGCHPQGLGEAGAVKGRVDALTGAWLPLFAGDALVILVHLAGQGPTHPPPPQGSVELLAGCPTAAVGVGAIAPYQARRIRIPAGPADPFGFGVGVEPDVQALPPRARHHRQAIAAALSRQGEHPAAAALA